ncbi:recombinase family protein [Magnetospirillum sp. SS-4]|uniref:recombinase family protein n=1 Tax=Magnetospirillum sp. SS-4 TaxID=2681465 RepID=UPI0034CDCF1C
MRVTHRGNRFHVGAVHDILSRTAYIGTHYFNRREAKSKTEKPKSEWVGTSVPAIVDEEVFHRVQANLKARNPKKIAPRTVSGPTLLTGVATCSDCGGGMTLRTGKGGAYPWLLHPERRDGGRRRPAASDGETPAATSYSGGTDRTAGR